MADNRTRRETLREGEYQAADLIEAIRQLSDEDLAELVAIAERLAMARDLRRPAPPAEDRLN